MGESPDADWYNVESIVNTPSPFFVYLYNCFHNNLWLNHNTPAICSEYIEVQFWRGEEIEPHQQINRLWNGNEYSPYFIITYNEWDFDDLPAFFDFPAVLNTNSTEFPEMWAGSQY